MSSDRHVVNKNYFEQLKYNRASFCQKCYHSFTSYQLMNLAMFYHMNQLFCGMHAIIGMANVCKEALKDLNMWQLQNLSQVDFKRECRCFDILMELSKALTTSHGYQKGGDRLLESYLSQNQLSNHIISFHRERINVLYVISCGSLLPQQTHSRVPRT